MAYCTSAFEVIAGRLSCDVTHHLFYHGLAIDHRVRGIHVQDNAIRYKKEHKQYCVFADHPFAR